MNAVRTRIAYWLSQGVIIETSPDVFQAAKAYSSVVKGKSFMLIISQIDEKLT